MNVSWQDAIKRLEKSPMFILSLSSKELFHSNFLYWIWTLNPKSFLSLLDKFRVDTSSWGNPKDDWVVEREYLSFDVCVKRPDKIESIDGTPRIIYGDVLFVLENKVKSIPYKDQLDTYKKKVDELYGKRRTSDAQKVQYVLLTLMAGFPEQEADGWEVVKYTKYVLFLKEIVEDLSLPQNEQEEINSAAYVTSIIEDYIEFLENLITLYDEWSNNCYDKLGFIYKEGKTYKSEYIKYIEAAQKIRIHDLYHKSKYAKICAELRTKVLGALNNLIPNDEYKVGYNVVSDKAIFSYLNESNSKQYYIVFGVGYTQGTPLFEVKVAKKGAPNIIYIIQVQGGNYEHGIIMNHSLLKEEGSKAEKVWKYIGNESKDNIFSVGDYPWLRYEDFKGEDPLADETKVIPVDRSIFSDITPGLFPVSKGHAKTPYAKYAGDSVYAMLYQFRKLKEDVATSAVIDYTVKDVINLLKALK